MKFLQDELNIDFWELRGANNKFGSYNLKHLSIQEDHVALISHAAKLLSADGILYFSTNFRRFKLDIQSLEHLHIKDISAQTIPEDFSRSPRIHYCWEIKCR